MLAPICDIEILLQRRRLSGSIQCYKLPSFSEWARIESRPRGGTAREGYILPHDCNGISSPLRLDAPIGCSQIFHHSPIRFAYVGSPPRWPRSPVRRIHLRVALVPLRAKVFMESSSLDLGFADSIKTWRHDGQVMSHCLPLDWAKV